MPTKKPIVQTVLEEQYYNKLKEIAEINGNRKISDQARRIIEKYIDDYETANGAIATNKTINMQDNNGTINM